MKAVKIILDTDIGDDIDDAFALALCDKHPDIELQGVTTVFKNTEARAKQVLKYFHETKVNNIPVHSGVGKPLKEPIRLFDKDVLKNGVYIPPQYSEDYEHYINYQTQAVDFIYQKALELKGELIIVAIGPLTNIATSILKYPDLKYHVKRIVLMGGWFTQEIPEWNILCDPEAADIVFRSGIEVYAVGLDVTLQCTLEADLLETLFNKHDAVSLLLAKWFKRWDDFFNFQKSVMHDPLAIATLVSDVCTFEKKYICINLTDNRGATIVLNSNENGSPIYVATTVDKDKFYQIITTYLL